MKVIFIGGSKTIKALPRGAMEFLDAKLSEGDVRFIVGDSFGVDRAAQVFLAHGEGLVADIKVYASEGRVRNNPCGLPVVAVPAEGFRGRDFYRQKDIAMACEATEGLMIWDGKSKGTYLDIHHLLSLGKPVTLFLRGREEAIQLQTSEQYRKFIITRIL